MMNDLEIDIDKLILLVKERPVLWDKTLDIYKDRKLIDKAWLEICLDFDEDFESRSQAEKKQFCSKLLKKWTNLRDSWIKACKKGKAYKKSSAKGSKPREYKYSDEMSFLSKIARREERSSLDEEKYVAQTNAENQFTQQRVKVKEVETEPKHPIPHTPSKVLPQNESVHRPTTSLGFFTPPSSSNTRGIKRKFNDSELEMLETLEEVQSKEAKMNFFKGILPLLKDFNNDQIIDFQIGVLMTIKTVQSQNAVPPSHTSQHCTDIPVPSDNHQKNPSSAEIKPFDESSTHEKPRISHNPTQQSTSSNEYRQNFSSSESDTESENSRSADSDGSNTSYI